MCRWGQPLGLDLTEKGNGGDLVKELTVIKRTHPCKIILCQVRSVPGDVFSVVRRHEPSSAVVGSTSAAMDEATPMPGRCKSHPRREQLGSVGKRCGKGFSRRAARFAPRDDTLGAGRCCCIHARAVCGG